METIKIVRELIGQGLNPGEPRTKGGLTVIPLRGGAVAKEYIVAEEAFAEGTLRITEKGEGEVPELVAINEGGLPVLILDGEQLEGAKQNRVLNASVLLPAHSTTMIPVACVEQGRWRFDRGTEFAVSPDHAYARLRGKNASAKAASVRAGAGHQVDQHEVWGDVQERIGEFSARSDTSAMKDAYDHRRKELNDIIDAFREVEPGQTGAIACIAGRPVALDAFDRPEVFARIWARLVSGYAADALAAPEAEVTDGAVVTFLAAVSGGHLTQHDGVALGVDVVITSPEVVGNALTWDEGVVHVALFASSADTDRAASRGGGIARPTQRRHYRD
jgi:hypothetical protein